MERFSRQATLSAMLKSEILLCKDLKDGMLISLSDDKFCAWFNKESHDKHKAAWGEDIPQRIRVGANVIGALFSSKVFTNKDTLIYVGKKLVVSPEGDKKRQIRLILAGGQLGFLEGYDVKHFEPVENTGIKPRLE